jgi:hypothetical protein
MRRSAACVLLAGEDESGGREAERDTRAGARRQLLARRYTAKYRRAPGKTRGGRRHDVRPIRAHAHHLDEALLQRPAQLASSSGYAPRAV